MERRVKHHGVDVVGGRTPEIRGGCRAGRLKRPAGEDFRHLGDGRLIVGGDGQPGGIEFERAVGLELIEADGEELHDLARVVLVGRGEQVALVIVGGLRAAQRAEVDAHDRAERDVFEQGAEIAEGAVHKQVVVVRHALRVVEERAVNVGDDKELAQGEGDALTELIGRSRGDLPPRSLAILVAELRVVAQRRVGVEVRPRGVEMQRGGERHLRGDPAVEIDEAFARECVDFGPGRAEG